MVTMKWIYAFVIMCCLAQLNARHAMAQDEDSADYNFSIGRYDVASDIAEQQGNYELAIRAAMIQGGYIAQKKDAEMWLERAITLAHKALPLDEKHLKNRLSLALALSYKAKMRRSVSLVRQAKGVIVALIDDYPDEAMSHGALAGWHSEISAAGFIPRLVLGASRAKARQSFKKALSLDAKEIPLNLEYAKFLARGNAQERRMAEPLLVKITEAQLQDAFEVLLQEKARIILPALRLGNKREIKRVIAENSAFSGF